MIKKHIFLTGSTGVVGSSVLPFLLKNNTDEIYLLVRANDNEQAKKRVQIITDFIREDISDQTFENRLHVISGDLDQENFGLSENEFSTLGKKLTHIIHCAASVDLTQPIEKAIHSTLLATRQILKLQSLSNAKLEYVSTVGVNGCLNQPLEEVRMTQQRAFFNSYEASKAKAEELVYSAIDEGRLITIHRPSMVVGHSKNGRIIHFQVFYFLMRLITGQLTYGFLPSVLLRKLDTIPSDFVGEIICESLNRPELSGKILHLCSGPQSALTLEEISKIARLSYKNEAIELPKIKILSIHFFEAITKLKYLFSAHSKWHKRLELLPQFLSYASQDQNFMNDKTKQYFIEKKWPEPRSYLSIVFDYYVQNKEL